MQVTLVTCLLVASLVACAGCGGGGDRLSRGELISQVDAICAQYSAEARTFSQPESVEEVEEFAARLRANSEQGLDELRALEPPEDLEDEYDEWVSSGTEGLELLDELGEAGAQGDQDRVQEISEEINRGNEETARRAKEIGFHGCQGEGGSGGG